MALGFLPKVDACCFSIDLKIGSILIAIYCLLLPAFGNFSGDVVKDSACKLALKVSDMHSLIEKVDKIRYGVGALLFIGAILLLIGILAQVRVLCTIFIIIAFIFFVLESIIVVLYLIDLIMNLSNCSITAIIPYVLQMIFPLLLLYFIVCVNSYEEEM